MKLTLLWTSITPLSEDFPCTKIILIQFEFYPPGPRSGSLFLNPTKKEARESGLEMRLGKAV